MEVDNSLVTFILATYYNMSPIVGSIKPLCGYSDKNFTFTDKNDNNRYVLKIVNKDESQPELTGKSPSFKCDCSHRSHLSEYQPFY